MSFLTLWYEKYLWGTLPHWKLSAGNYYKLFSPSYLKKNVTKLATWKLFKCLTHVNKIGKWEKSSFDYDHEIIYCHLSFTKLCNVIISIRLGVCPRLWLERVKRKIVRKMITIVVSPKAIKRKSHPTLATTTKSIIDSSIWRKNRWKMCNS